MAKLFLKRNREKCLQNRTGKNECKECGETCISVCTIVCPVYPTEEKTIQDSEEKKIQRTCVKKSRECLHGPTGRLSVRPR